MRIALLYPPAGDVRSPQLALPSLAAYLRASGHTVSMRDLNLEAVIHLIQPPALEKAAAALRQKNATSPSLQRLLKLSPAIIRFASTAHATLRDANHFYDPHAFNNAREAINLAAALHAATSPLPVAWQITPLRYDIGNVDPAKLTDLLTTTANPAGNLFAELWQQQLLPELAEDSPDLIGITLTNRQQWWPGLYLARLLHEAGHRVVLGGALISKFAETLRSRPRFFQTFCRAVIVYEGEHALDAMLNALAQGHGFVGIPNVLYLDEQGRVQAGATHVEEVPCLPTPDFHGLPLADYFAPTPVLPILTGKGCYFNRCKFCDIPHINHVSRKAYRVRPVTRILDDITTLEREHGCRHFLITDEALAPKLLAELADALHTAGKTGLSFTGYARFEAGFTAAICHKLAAMGIRKLYFGLESASQRTIDHMDKGVKVENICPTLAHCQQAGIHFHIFSIIGFPEEDETEARKTFQFFIDNAPLINNPGNSFDIHPFGLQLHTAYFDEHARHGILISPDTLKRDFLIGLDHTEWHNQRGLSPERIQHLISHEFYPALRATYHRWHNTPLHLWPGFEEYAILYSAWYANRPFLALTSIEGLDIWQGFHVCWTPLSHIEHQDAQTILTLPDRELTIPTVLFHVLSVEGYWTLRTLTAAFFGETAADDPTAHTQVARTIHHLAGCRAIQLTLSNSQGHHA